MLILKQYEPMLTLLTSSVSYLVQVSCSYMQITLQERAKIMQKIVVIINLTSMTLTGCF